jgi:hypothetical protein
MGWGLNLYPVVSDATVDAADYQMDQVLGDRHTRLQVHLQEASEAMDDASEGNLQGLKADAETLIRPRRDAIGKIASSLA